MQEGWITGSYNALKQPVGVTTAGWDGSGNWMWFGYESAGALREAVGGAARER